MSYRAYIQTKHEIEFGEGHFNGDNEAVDSWLNANGVDVEGSGDYGQNPDWAMRKDELKDIPESAYDPNDENVQRVAEGFDGDAETASEALRDFVKDLIAAPTGEYAYVTWC